MKKLLPYLSGIAIFLILLVAGVYTGNDYGVSWDEPDQRLIGTLAFDYVFNGKKDLLTYAFRQYGTGYEIVLVWFEKLFKLNDTREVYFMRHQVTHILFLLSALALYIMSFRISRNAILSVIAMLVFVFCPRIYAHSFFNTKDIPFLCMVTITLALTNLAFDKNKIALYILLGAVAGYTTSIRVMGVMPFVFIMAMLIADYLAAAKLGATAKKEKLTHVLGFAITFPVVLYLSWPYLWLNPFGNFMESYNLMSHYQWDGQVLINGAYERAVDLPSGYFPNWFAISVPLLWLLAGIAGAIFVVIDLFKKPKSFFVNGPERNFLLLFLCFVMPVFAVIKLHSVIYDDWRHLYFTYPAFAMLALYLMVRFYNAKTRFVMIGLAALQVAMVGYFMVNNHPFQQVYFNELVSKESEYLRANFELDYWGCSFKNGLEYIAKNDKSQKLKINGNFQDPISHNLLILDPKDRARFEYVDFAQATYFLTNFRGHAEDYPSADKPSKDIDYNITVLNSSILRVYNLKKINGK